MLECWIQTVALAKITSLCRDTTRQSGLFSHFSFLFFFFFVVDTPYLDYTPMTAWSWWDHVFGDAYIMYIEHCLSDRRGPSASGNTPINLKLIDRKLIERATLCNLHLPNKIDTAIGHEKFLLAEISCRGPKFPPMGGIPSLGRLI